MQKLLEPLAPAQGIVHVDATRNSSDHRRHRRKNAQTLRDDIALFDVDWLTRHVVRDVHAQLHRRRRADQGAQPDARRAERPDRRRRAARPHRSGSTRCSRSRTQTRYLEQSARLGKPARPARPGQRPAHLSSISVQNGRASDLAARWASCCSAAASRGRRAGDTPDGSAATTPSFEPGLPNSGVTPARPLRIQRAASAAAAPRRRRTERPGSGRRQRAGLGSISITADETNNALVDPGDAAAIRRRSSRRCASSTPRRCRCCSKRPSRK